MNRRTGAVARDDGGQHFRVPDAAVLELGLDHPLPGLVRRCRSGPRPPPKPPHDRILCFRAIVDAVTATEAELPLFGERLIGAYER